MQTAPALELVTSSNQVLSLDPDKFVRPVRMCGEQLPVFDHSLIHAKCQELGHASAQVRVDGELYEYISLGASEYQFYRSGDTPTNYSL